MSVRPKFYILPDIVCQNRISGPVILERPCSLLTLLVGVEEASISGFHSKTVAQSTNIDTNLKCSVEDHTKKIRPNIMYVKEVLTHFI